MSLGVRDGGKIVKQIDLPSPKGQLRTIFSHSTGAREEGPDMEGLGEGLKSTERVEGEPTGEGTARTKALRLEGLIHVPP